MSVKYQIDDIDRKILSHLVKNARIPFLEIARECGISGAAIHQRVKKMEDSGIIEGSRFIVKPDALGFGVCAFIGVILDHAHTYKTVVKEIESIPEVTECHFITGGFTFLIKLRCNDHQHLMDILINTLQNIPGIAKTETFISLDQLIEKQIALSKTIQEEEKYDSFRLNQTVIFFFFLDSFGAITFNTPGSTFTFTGDSKIYGSPSIWALFKSPSKIASLHWISLK